MSFVGADKAYADSVDELRADLNKEINARAEDVLGMGIAIGVLTDKDNALDSKLDAEIAARIGADAAQDKVIAQVNQNLVDSVNAIYGNIATIVGDLNNTDAIGTYDPTTTQ